MSKMDWMDDLRAAESGDPYFATPEGDFRRCVAERKALGRIKELEGDLSVARLRLKAREATYVSERIKELEAERDKWQSKAHHLNCEMIGTKRLREALENAPEPGTGIISAMHYKGTDALIKSVSYDLSYDLYVKWFDDVRSKALGEDE